MRNVLPNARTQNTFHLGKWRVFMGIRLEQAHRQVALMHARVSKDRLALNIVNLQKDIETALNLLSEALTEQFDADGHPDQKFGAITYAQHGDDFMILNLFKLMGIDRPSYLDLGAHDPEIISNTALLYAKGSRGINVEANPLLIPRFKELRPYDRTVNVGVGVEKKLATFYMYSDSSGRNTFSPHEVKMMEGTLSVVQEIELPVTTILDIVNSYWDGKFPDFLNCDLEGMDYEVLETLPEGGIELPKVIVVETRLYDSVRMEKLLNSKGYCRICRMGENLFFIRYDLKERVK